MQTSYMLRGNAFEVTSNTHTPTHLFNSPLSGTTHVSRYQKGKTNLDLLKQESEWQWHQLGHMQVCTLPQTDNHASIPPLSFLQAGYPSCRPTNSVKALKVLKQQVSKQNIGVSKVPHCYGNCLHFNSHAT